MNNNLNRRCHAVAGQLSEDPHQLLSHQANELGLESWSQVTDAQARDILGELQDTLRRSRQLTDLAQPGRSTRAQRDKISAIRHSMRWSWSYVRQLVREYGVEDWRDLTQEDADHLIQRMGQISKNIKRRDAQKAEAQT